MQYYLVESDTVQPAWVKAKSELGAKRIHATRYGDDQELTIAEQTDDITYSVELERKGPPFRAMEENEDGDIIIHEKRVNQAGSKGIYRLKYSP
jgi:hypothetical protein